MLRPRIIPTLLVHKGGLYKTRKFSEPKYVGDPLNAVKIFNEKLVDELFVADIDASVLKKEPDFNLIENLASECRMPLCYAGGVKTIRHVEHIISLGVEKVALGSAYITNPDLISEAAHRVGSQSVVVVLDVKQKMFVTYENTILNGKKGTGKDPVETAIRAQELGAGELLVNSVDNDGMMSGYNIEVIRKIRENVTIPITVLGGAGHLSDIEKVIEQFGTIGVSAGSLFVFKGKYRAVLIQYPDSETKDKMVMNAMRNHGVLYSSTNKS